MAMVPVPLEPAGEQDSEWVGPAYCCAQEQYESQGAACTSLPDGIPGRGTALGRPPVSLFALARTGYGPLRRKILGTVVTKKEQK